MYAKYDPVKRPMDIYVNGYGKRIPDHELTVHHPDLCAKQPECPIHKPSDHHMASWPRVWYQSTQSMFRRCPHDYEHPDPDHEAHMVRLGHGLDPHECDGCCGMPIPAPPVFTKDMPF